MVYGCKLWCMGFYDFYAGTPYKVCKRLDMHSIVMVMVSCGCKLG